MSRSNLEVRRCDRCGHEQTIAAGERLQGWAVMHAHADGTVKIGHGEGDADDLCGGCMKSLLDWFMEIKGSVEQATPKPATSEPRLPPFTPGDRQRAIEAVNGALSMQVYEVIAAYSEEPTALIAGQTLPAAIAGVPRRAEAIVDELVAKLRPPRKKGAGK